MAYYVPTPRSERSAFHEPPPGVRESALTSQMHRNNNCTCACAAAAADYETLGKVKVHAGDMRHAQNDMVYGTDMNDMKIAWGHFGLDLGIRSTRWPGVIDALQEGRCVLLPGHSKYLDGMCSQSQRVEHCILLHPRGMGAAVGSKIYTMDPWCNPARWEFVDRDVLKRYWSALGWSFGVTRGRKP